MLRVDLVLLSTVEVMSSGNDGESGEGTRAGVTHVSFVASEAAEASKKNGERINAQVRLALTQSLQCTNGGQAETNRKI